MDNATCKYKHHSTNKVYNHCFDRDSEHHFLRKRNIPIKMEVRKQARGRCLLCSLYLYFECINSTGHICERRIHFFNVIRQWCGETCTDPAVLAYLRVRFFIILMLSDDLNIYMTFLEALLIFSYCFYKIRCPLCLSSESRKQFLNLFAGF